MLVSFEPLGDRHSRYGARRAPPPPPNLVTLNESADDEVYRTSEHDFECVSAAALRALQLIERVQQAGTSDEERRTLLPVLEREGLYALHAQTLTALLERERQQQTETPPHETESQLRDQVER